MPLFFIDTDDERLAVTDEEGYELADAQAARALALKALSDMLRSDQGARDRCVFTARVRAEDGGTLYTAALTLTGEWEVTPPVA